MVHGSTPSMLVRAPRVRAAGPACRALGGWLPAYALALLWGCGGDEAAPACDPAACPAGYVCSVAGPCMPSGGCVDARDCEPGQSCSDQLCTFDPAETCGSNQDCFAGEFCSEDARCIEVGTCADPADCPQGENCSPGHLCLPGGSCERNADCHEGTICEDGQCVPGGGCGESEYGIDAPPNLLILLDRSGSMDDEIDGRPKWEIAVEALQATIGDWDGTIRFGLALFSNCEEGGDCSPGAVEIPCGPDTSADISARLESAPRCSSTPIGASLNAMVGQATIQETDRENAVLLVTDGIDSCDGDPPGGAAALVGQAIPVRTYVVGFGGEVDADQLRATAEAAGTAAGAEGYYQADDAGGLAAALGAIAGRLIGCTYPLSGVPEDPALLYVFFNNEPDRIAQDEANGWRYDAATNSVIFSGDACTRIESGEVQDIDIVYGCPEPVI